MRPKVTLLRSSPQGAELHKPRLSATCRTAASGRMAIELRSGIRVSVDASVDADALGRVLAVLAR